MIWQSVTFPETITLCTMSGPRTVSCPVKEKSRNEPMRPSEKVWRSPGIGLPICFGDELVVKRLLMCAWSRASEALFSDAVEFHSWLTSFDLDAKREEISLLMLDFKEVACPVAYLFLSVDIDGHYKDLRTLPENFVGCNKNLRSTFFFVWFEAALFSRRFANRYARCTPSSSRTLWLTSTFGQGTSINVTSWTRWGYLLEGGYCFSNTKLCSFQDYFSIILNIPTPRTAVPACL